MDSFSSTASSGISVKLVFVDVGEYYTASVSITPLLISKTMRGEVSKKKRTHRAVERAGTSHLHTLSLNPGTPVAKCITSYLSLWASLRLINVRMQWQLLPVLSFILFIYQWRGHLSESCTDTKTWFSWSRHGNLGLSVDMIMLVSVSTSLSLSTFKSVE